MKFRKDNGRIKAEVESYQKSNNVILNEESAEGQKLLKEFLIKNDKDSNEALKKLLIHKGQKDPAIITCDGFLINGNRRKMALEDLYVERDQDSNFEMMRVVILPEGVSELDIQKIENRYQLQGEGKSEYQGLNRALTIKRNIEKGFTLRAQLKDDPQYHDLPAKELTRKEDEYKKKFLMPLECVDRYLKLFDNEGLYNLISENVNDKEGRWQAFLDYSNFYNGTLNNPAKQVDYKIKENEVRKIENAIFKIIRKRSLNSKALESAIGKLHDFVRKAPKYLKNTDAKKFILKIADDVPEDVPEALKTNKDGEKYDERTIDDKWGTHYQHEILGNLMQAHKIVANQSERDLPLELLEDSLKKLNHENLIIGNMDVKDYDKAMELTKKIISKAEDIYGDIDKARFQLKKLKKG
ncbi:MAG: endonuclease [Mucilaginibacter sp.]|nr:endonuclease [Mucilaginibacter sp.]